MRRAAILSCSLIVVIGASLHSRKYLKEGKPKALSAAWLFWCLEIFPCDTEVRLHRGLGRETDYSISEMWKSWQSWQLEQSYPSLSRGESPNWPSRRVSTAKVF